MSADQIITTYKRVGALPASALVDGQDRQHVVEAGRANEDVVRDVESGVPGGHGDRASLCPASESVGSGNHQQTDGHRGPSRNRSNVAGASSLPPSQHDNFSKPVTQVRCTRLTPGMYALGHLRKHDEIFLAPSDTRRRSKRLSDAPGVLPDLGFHLLTSGDHD